MTDALAQRAGFATRADAMLLLARAGINAAHQHELDIKYQ